MKIVGAKVKHAKFGEGVIVAVRGNIIDVDFNGLIKHLATEVFAEKFTFEDENVCALISEMGQKIKAEKEAQEAAKIAEKQAAIAAAKEAERVARYDPSYHAEYMSTDVVHTYQEVEEKFGIRIAGFGRGCYSKADNIVLISSVDPENENFVYHDRWDNKDDYIFSGEGAVGNQEMKRGNKAIQDAAANNKSIHLFIKESSTKYYYQGVFELVDAWIETEIGADGKARQEYKFRLRRV